MAESAAVAAPRAAAIIPNHRACRICGSDLPAPFLDFGPMPLANAFLASLEEVPQEARYPLGVAGCTGCGLVQLTHVVPAEQLYRNYIYVSSTSEGVQAHAAWLAQMGRDRYGFHRGGLLVEIASNDGTVLKAHQQAGIRVLGIEPAVNIARLAEAAGVPTVPEFFTARTAAAVAAGHGRAAGILARHVFAHVDDLHDFLEGADTLLEADGVLLIEVPYLGELIDRVAFDTIYHEHLSYMALQPVQQLLSGHGFELTDVDALALHGGSVLMHIRRVRAAAGASPRLRAMLEAEARQALQAPATHARFAAAVQGWREAFTGCVAGIAAQPNTRLIGYGAAAKANTLLNYCPSVAAALGCVLDRSPHKHGRYTPGTHLEVRPVERWRERQATHMVILAWNFKDEIIRQMREFQAAGGRFVIPIPSPVIL